MHFETGARTSRGAGKSAADRSESLVFGYLTKLRLAVALLSLFGAAAAWGRMERAKAVSFSAQSRASIAFVKRFSFAFLVQPFLVVLIAATLRLVRRRLQKVIEEKTDLRRAFPIVDLPVSTALVLSFRFAPKYNSGVALPSRSCTRL
jgi:hypothetical protein